MGAIRMAAGTDPNHRAKVKPYRTPAYWRYAALR
jgi:hypothetical protein